MKTKYKKSKYNYLFENEDKKYIYNTANEKLTELPTDIYNMFVRLPDKDIVLESSDISKLIERGYIVEEWVDEFAQVQFRRHEQIYSKDEFFIMVIPTNGCNFNCVYCSQNTKRNIMTDVVKEQLISFIKKKSQGYKHIRINWFGGEPLLEYKSIIDIMTALKQDKQIKVPIIGDITTNGYLLTVDVFKELIKNNVLYFQITLDGLPERHNRTRPLKGGGETYSIIKNNLKQIKETIPSKNFKVVIRTNIDNTFFAQVDEFINMCVTIFKGDGRFLFYPKLVVDMGGDKIEQVKEHLIDTNMTLYNVICKMKRAGLCIYDEFTNVLEKQDCYAAKVGAYVINYDGMIYKCNTIIGEYSEQHISQYNQLGDLNEELNENVIQTKNAKWVMRTDISKGCKRCILYPICNGGFCCAKYHMKIKECLRETDYLETRLKLMILYGYYYSL